MLIIWVCIIIYHCPPRNKKKIMLIKINVLLPISIPWRIAPSPPHATPVVPNHLLAPVPLGTHGTVPVLQNDFKIGYLPGMSSPQVSVLIFWYLYIYSILIFSKIIHLLHSFLKKIYLTKFVVIILHKTILFICHNTPISIPFELNSIFKRWTK